MRVLIAGYGSVGQYLLDFILKDHRISPEDLERIYIVSRKNKDEVEPRINVSRISAGLSDRFIPVDYFSYDFNDEEGLSGLLADLKPDIIVYAGRMVSGIKYGSSSYSKGIGYGVWVPLSLSPIIKFMRSVKKSGIKCKVINTSFPDLSNNILINNGYDVFCGAGNINHVVPRIKRAVNNIWMTKSDMIEVRLIGTHFLNTYVTKEGTNNNCPFYLRVIDKNRGEDIVNYVGDLSPDYRDSGNDKERLTAEKIISNCKDVMVSDHTRNQMIATDCAEIVRLLLSKDEEVIHIPGYKGSLGGEPIILSRFYSRPLIREYNKAITLKGLELDGAVPFNGGKGIRFTDKSINLMKEVYNIDYPQYVSFKDIESFAEEIVSKMGWNK